MVVITYSKPGKEIKEAQFDGVNEADEWIALFRLFDNDYTFERKENAKRL